jgi:hypothetical protein
MSWPNQPTPGIILARPVNPVNRFRPIAALVSLDTSTNERARAVLKRREGTRFSSPSDDEVGARQRRDPCGASASKRSNQIRPSGARVP